MHLCAINTFTGDKKNRVHELKKMSFSLKHRGPYDDGEWFSKTAFISLRRLKIIDLSNKSKQPMNFNRYILTFNGEIYNYKELKNKLEKWI